MKKDFDIKDDWVSLEIHPETPEQGVSLAEKFAGANLEAMNESLKRAGEPFGIIFAGHKILSNSKLALEASEFAKDQGKFHEFHENIFYAYFTELKDIGDKDVVLDVAEKSGLNSEILLEALNNGTYGGKLREAQQLGQAYGVTGTPTIIVNDQYKIVGAQPINAIRDFLRKLEQEGQ